MTTPIRRRWRLFKRGLWYTVAGVLLLLALGNGIGGQLLQLAERHPQAIADWLSMRAQRKVAFDHVETQWTRRGPLLRLDNLRIGDGADAVRIGDAEILVAQYTGLLPGHSFTELRLRGLALTLQRAADGTWQVRGLPGQQQTQGDPLAALERLGELQVARASLHILAPALDIDLHLPRIDLRLQVNGAHVRVGARAWLRETASPFAAAADFDRNTGNGQVYAGARRLDLQEVAGSVSVIGITPVSGRGRLQAWAQLRGHRVVAVRADASLLDLALGEASTVGEGGASHALSKLALGKLVLDASWSGSLQDWQLRVPRLRVGDGAQRQVLDGLAATGGRQFALQAPHLQLGPLLQIAALSNVLPATLRGWLHRTTPDVELEQLQLHRRTDGALSVSARLRDFEFAAAGHAPGLRGVGGWLQADADGLRLRFDPQAQVTFDWPAGFGVAHNFTLEGEAVLWRDGEGKSGGWTVHTPGLLISGSPLRVQARGGIGFQNDGSLPRLDLAADIGDVPVSVAHGFWIHHLMPAGTVQWLDAALQGGTLRNTHAVVAGDLDDWPFRNEPGLAGAGVFRAETHIENGKVKFQPDWPAAEAMHADVRFVADGFTAEGSARLAGVNVPTFKAGIARFGKAELQIDAGTRGDAGNFLSLLRASPLHKEYGDILDGLRAAGPAQADFHMRLPLHHDTPAPPQIHGTVTLAGARLGEARWKLDFDQVQGQARYDRGGFVAEGLRVQHGGVAGTLSLRAGPHVQDPKQVFEAELQANLGVDELIDKAGSLQWLKPSLDGSSVWTVALSVPHATGQGAAVAARLKLQSNLVGTAISLPQPLKKSAAQALPASVALRLPMEKGEVEVTLGKLLSLRSRSTPQQTGVRVQLGGARADAPPTLGLAVDGQVDQLDALDWIGVVAGGSGDAALPLRRIEVDAKRLRLLGAEFADTTLTVAPAAQGTAVQVQGGSIAGALMLPAQERGTVAGRFQRLYWAAPSNTPATVGQANNAQNITPQNITAQTAAATTPTVGFDPAGIPPLLFDIDDLRIGSTPLGAAKLRTTPVANGLRLDEFRTRDSKQRMHATGSWIGRDTAAWTQLHLDVDSDDVGALLSGVGFAGQVNAGKGQLAVDANWRGGPETLDPKRMQATLKLDVRNGQLLEIEPGAGRVLGLFGFAQLPRRLMLDFSDFFGKGFAFDHMQGDVRLRDGSARTENLLIKGPAADIHLHGSVDLRRQRFDQTVDVSPKSGGLLTAVGALAAGPVGAAVGAVANAVLDKPLQALGAKSYKITGPWASPKVEVIERKQSEPGVQNAAAQ